MADLRSTRLPGIGEQYAVADHGGLKYQRCQVELFPGPSTDAFGRLRASEPVALFESKLLASDKAPLHWDEALESGGGITGSTPTAAKPYIDFTSTDSTAGVYTRQTFRRFNYQPGKSQLILITGVLKLSGGGTGVERRIGYFDDNNGVFFEDDGGTVGVTIRSNDSGTPVDTTVVQSDWNIDKMDGSSHFNTNPSEITADWKKAHIFVIDFQWLSVGLIRFGLEIDGQLWYVHQTANVNTSAIPWGSTPNLPLRYQMITTASSPASEMRCICSAVLSEGGREPLGTTHSHATTDHVNGNTQDTVYALLGLRLKSDQLGCTVEPESVSILAETNDDFEWQLIMNPTVAGTFTYSDKTNSCVQTATGDTDNPSTNTVTGGTILQRGFGSGNSDKDTPLRTSLLLGAAIDGTRDELVLAVRPLGNGCDAQGALNWREMI